MIHFAHGPWWSEWHHFISFIPIIGGSLALAWHWIKTRRGK